MKENFFLSKKYFYIIYFNYQSTYNKLIANSSIRRMPLI